MYAYNKNKFAWLSFPYHQPTHYNADIDALFQSQKRILLLRYCEPLDGNGVESHRIACTDKNYGLSCLSSRARTQTRRGLENCVVEKVNPADLKTSGFTLFNSTRIRQGRPLDGHAHKTWALYCDAASKINGFSAWGAWSGNNLASLLIGFQIGNCFNILRQASDSELVRQFPNNAVVYEATRQTLHRSDVTEISYGLAPIAKPVQSLDDFKQRMGYQAIPIRQNVASKSTIKPLLPAASLLATGVGLIKRNAEQVNQVRAMLSVAARYR